MTPDDDALARRIGRELASLPPPRAPRTLLPRLLAAVDRPWYARAWLTWPVEAQLASAIALAAVIAGGGLLLAAAPELGTVSALARIGWRQVVLPSVAHLFATAVLASLVVTLSWAAIARVALGGTAE